MQRPGISEAKLREAGVREVDALTAEKLCGVQQSGLWIPYYGVEGEPIMENGKPYGRLRMARPEGSKKYHQELGTGVHVYIPPGVKRCDVIVEGEFKALALNDLGIQAVGISGFYGFGSNGKLDEKLDYLIAVLESAGDTKTTLEFLGDSDTTHNYQFSLAATKLNGLVKDRVVLTMPRIPLNGPKGIDDLVDGMSPEAGLSAYTSLPRVEFDQNWEERRGAAECANAMLRAENPESLRVAMEGNPKICGRVFETLAFMSSSALTQQKACDYVRDEVLGTKDKRAFNAEMKDATQRLKDMGESTVSEAVQQSMNKAIEEGYPSGNMYYFPTPAGHYSLYTREALADHLEIDYDLSTQEKTSGRGRVSSCRYVMSRIKGTKPEMHYIGHVAGYPKGTHEVGGTRFLNTEDVEITKAVEGPWDVHREFLERYCGRDEGEKHWETQFEVLMGWLQQARMSFRAPLEGNTEEFHGQFLAMIGDPGVGKTWWQKNVLPKLFTANGRFILQRAENLSSQFNAEMVASELVVFSDSTGSEDYHDRAAIAKHLRGLVANGHVMGERKGVDRVSLPVRQRLVSSANVTGLSALPPLVSGIKDKVVYLWVYAPALWDGPKDPKARKVTAKLEEQISGFCYAIDHWPVAEHLREKRDRFGVKAWHHPAIAGLADEDKPWDVLIELLDRYLGQRAKTDETEWMTANELFDELNSTLMGGELERTFPRKKFGWALRNIRNSEELSSFVLRRRRHNGYGQWSLRRVQPKRDMGVGDG